MNQTTALVTHSEWVLFQNYSDIDHCNLCWQWQLRGGKPWQQKANAILWISAETQYWPRSFVGRMQVSVSNWSSIVFAAAQAINLICVKEIVAIHHQQDLSFMLIFQCNSISSSAVQAELELHSSYIRTPWRFFFITGEEGFIPNMFCCCGKDDPVRRNSKCQIGQVYEQCTQNKISVKEGKNSGSWN